MFRLRQMRRVVSGVAMSLLMTGGALAATQSPAVTCATSDVRIGGAGSLHDALSCAGPIRGNDVGYDFDGLFGLSGWNVITPRTGLATQSTAGAGMTSGTWAVTSWADFTNYFIVLKGGPSFSAYLIDVALGKSGTFDTQGIVKGNGTPGPALSHFDIYATSQSAELTELPLVMPPAVPLPAGGVLLLSALGIAAIVRRRRQAA